MKLIVGLGNPGKKYAKNRHNVGFMLLDRLAKRLEFPTFKEESKFKAMISQGEFNGEKVILARPLTYMNLSGETVLAISQFYKISLENIWICYDDLDLSLGIWRFREKGSAGTHNGMKSIIEKLGSDNFFRFRVGIESRGISVHEKQETTDFVLGNFTEEEKKIVEESINQVMNFIVEKLET